MTAIFGVLLLTSCPHNHPPIDLPLTFEAKPPGDVDRARIADTCPDFTGVYKSEILPSETMYVSQEGCERITISQESRSATQRNTYFLDGVAITERKYLMHSIPFKARFRDGELHFEGDGDGYRSFERWELTSENGINEESYAKRDNGEIYNHSRRSYYRVRSSLK